MTPKPILTMYFEAIYLFFLHFNINGFTTNANSHILLNITWNTSWNISAKCIPKLKNAVSRNILHTHKNYNYFLFIKIIGTLAPNLNPQPWLKWWHDTSICPVPFLIFKFLRCVNDKPSRRFTVTPLTVPTRDIPDQFSPTLSLCQNLQFEPNSVMDASDRNAENRIYFQINTHQLHTQKYFLSPSSPIIYLIYLT